MTNTPTTERRRLKRIGCTYQPRRQSSVLLSGKRSYSVSLMDLHNQGARLRFMDISSAAAVDVGDSCRFNIHIEPQGLECGPLPCSIAWKMGAELGVNFDTGLDMPVRNLLRALDS